MPPVLSVLAAALALAVPDVYSEHCARCHGLQGEGTENAPSLAEAGAQGADFYLRTGYMPLASPDAQPTRNRVSFSDEELDALIQFVASLGTGPPVPTPQPERGDVAEGLELFTANCAGCHQIVAEGGYVPGARVPPLDEATPVQIAEAVRIGPYLMPAFPEETLSDQELDSLIAYVAYAKDPEDPGGWPLGHLGPIPEGMVTWLIAAVLLVATCVLIGKRLRGGEE